MRHRRKTKHFSRKSNPRKALLRGLVCSLVECGRIKTTITKAKELRRHVEKAITLGKTGNLNARRVLLADFPNKATVETIMSDLAVRFKERAGGYTRILKLSNRPGDCAPQAFIEFVDYDASTYAEKKVKVKVRGKDRKLVTKELNRKELVAHNTKVNEKAAFARYKNIKTMQKEARRVLRANS